MLLGRRTRRALCTAATGPFADLLAISAPTLGAYARQHRFDLVAVTDETAAGRPAAWGKIPIVQGLLDDYDIVAWVDADAVIVDRSRDLTDELRRGKHLYLVEHHHEPSGEVTANTGVFMLRSGPWARAFLAAVWAREDLIDHRWWENAAVMELLGYRIDPQPAGRERHTEWLARTHFLDVAWNSMPHWCASPTPLINHYASLPLVERRARMIADLA